MVVLLVALGLAGGAEKQRLRNGVVFGIVERRVVVVVGEKLRREPKLAVVQIVSHGKTQSKKFEFEFGKNLRRVMKRVSEEKKERREKVKIWICEKEGLYRTEAFPLSTLRLEHTVKRFWFFFLIINYY